MGDSASRHDDDADDDEDIIPVTLIDGGSRRKAVPYQAAKHSVGGRDQRGSMRVAARLQRRCVRKEFISIRTVPWYTNINHCIIHYDRTKSP